MSHAEEARFQADLEVGLPDFSLLREQVPALSETALESLYACAYGFYGQGRYQEACRIFLFLSTHDFSNAKYYKGMGACLHMLKRHAQAIIAYGAAWSLDADDITVLFHLAQCLMAEDMLEDAELVLQEVSGRTKGNARHAALHERARGLLAQCIRR